MKYAMLIIFGIQFCFSSTRVHGQENAQDAFYQVFREGDGI